MKFATLIIVVPAALALPTVKDMSKRQDINTITDQLLFSDSLPDFINHRNAQNPPNLDWSSDGCTDSPDNPFGFPYLPACNRHDFGYQNYRAQSRFTKSNKLKIDNNFKADLDFQCQSVKAKTACEDLADVYYAAVRAFGGGDASPGKREESDEDLVKEYEAKLAKYHQSVKAAQAQGLLPILD